MKRIAAVDCGTNSLRLLVSDVGDGDIRQVTRTMEIIRLGEGVDETGRISPEAIERARVVLQNYTDHMTRENVRAVRMVATSASRDAENREEFFDMTENVLSKVQPGARAEVIDGTEEAKLSFIGAVKDLPPTDVPILVIDLGGGSTEFIVGKQSGEILGAYSTRMGCVRLTERFLHTQPPTPDEIAEAREYVRGELAKVKESVPVGQATVYVGCAGTFTTLSAIAQGLEHYDEQAIHMSTLRTEGLKLVTQDLLAQTGAQRAMLPVMHQGRADVIGGGCIVVEEIIDFMAREAGLTQITISEHDILDGIVAGLAKEVQ